MHKNVPQFSSIATPGAFGVQLAQELTRVFAVVDNFPRPGFRFPDITPLFEEQVALRESVVDAFVDEVRSLQTERLVLVDSFGYLLGVAAARELRLPLLLARRAGKLPRATTVAAYDMCYDEGRRVEIHSDVVRLGERCVIVDDIVGSGGTILAIAQLLERCGAVVTGACVAAQIPALRGVERLVSEQVPVRWISELHLY